MNLNGFGSSFSYSLKTSVLGKQLYTFLNKRWLFDKVYNDFVARPSLHFGYTISFKLVDKGFLEMFGPTGIMQQSAFMRHFVKTIQTGSIYHYAFMMFVSLTSILAFFLVATTSVGAFLDTRIIVLLFLSFFWLSDK